MRELPADTMPAHVPQVTRREAKVLNVMCRPAYERTGAWATNNDIEAELEMSHNTFRTHMRNIYAAFGLDGVADYRKRPPRRPAGAGTRVRRPGVGEPADS